MLDTHPPIFWVIGVARVENYTTLLSDGEMLSKKSRIQVLVPVATDRIQEAI
jgi:hypothetical protein